MKQIGFLLVALGTAMGSLQDDKQNPPPVPGWFPDLTSGMKEASSTGKPLLVVFRCTP